jgi:hypothetical protein
MIKAVKSVPFDSSFPDSGDIEQETISQASTLWLPGKLPSLQPVCFEHFIDTLKKLYCTHYCLLPKHNLGSRKYYSSYDCFKQLVQDFLLS